jgi:hypothetical protein
LWLQLKQALEAVDSRVKFEETATVDDVRTLIERVELRRDGVQVTLNLRTLLPTDPISEGRADLRMTRMVPMQMKRRGVETRLVIPGEATITPRSDPALLRAVAVKAKRIDVIVVYPNCKQRRTGRRGEMDSNSRYRFLNWQATAGWRGIASIWPRRIV